MSNVSSLIPEAGGQGDAWRKPLDNACNLIAPLWPLDQAVAVNPFWGLRALPAFRSDRLLSDRAGASMLMPAEVYRDAWDSGRISNEDLQASIAESGFPATESTLRDALGLPARPSAATKSSILARYPDSADGSGAASEVHRQVGNVCAAYFDKRQSRWLPAQPADTGLFEFWLKWSGQDLALDYRIGLPGARARLKGVSRNHAKAAAQAITALKVSQDELEALAHSLLLGINGWASWCRGVDWRASLAGQSSDLCQQLLSVLLVWESVGLECASDGQKLARERSRVKMARQDPVQEPDLLWVWQRAYEIGYQRTLLGALDANHRDRQQTGVCAEQVAVQAVFCIDVRSEVMRRHLEVVSPATQTLGFAGFFGLPVSYQPLGPFESRQRLPGLLAPPYRLIDTTGSVSRDATLNRQLDQQEIARESVRNAKYTGLSTFTLVETTGLAWAWKLVKDSLHRSSKKVPQTDSGDIISRLVHSDGGDPLTDAQKADLVANFLRGMSLTGDFAPLLVFVGHGSHTDNNPSESALACGACSGQNGGINAKLAATLFNDPRVRENLAKKGIRIPDFTWALAAEHCTVTDEVVIFDQDLIPDSHLRSLVELRAAFAEAGARVRRERAAALKLNGLDDAELSRELLRKSSDWSEIRPEWGLANNAAIIFAKRSRTRGANLAGRVFLHDYDPELDPEGAVLEGLLAAPMVVANWINLQYFASVTAPEIYGAGNKLLHSVVGGHIGVIEGDGTDLRIGLPIQSVHDGSSWRHEPVRLTVLVDAPRERIEQVIESQPDVARLVENQWLWLYRLTEKGSERYDNGNWQPPFDKPRANEHHPD